MEVLMADLATRQNSARILDLQRAIAVTHERSQRVYTAALVLSIAVAALGIVAKIAPLTAAAVSLAGALWTGAYTIILSPWADRYQRLSAALQEMMDRALFDLPANPVLVGAAVPEDQLSDLKNRYRGQESWLRDYYVVADVPDPYAALFCFEQNFAWGSKVRQRYAQMLAGLAVLWVATGVIVGLFTGMRVTALIGGWFVPSLGLLLLCLDTYRVQLSNNRERSRVREIVYGLSAESSTTRLTAGREWDALARQFLDVLFTLRRQQARTPVWFFRRYHDHDQRDFEYRKQVLEERFNRRPGP
ncbi:S-4TM family putative pore-forming effector [Micromonospora arborensis]|uniref:S-4TM family putative pore-forming effector n=1 Tax=Micromonospora arborensis TaxID=2116518 RepID=UPI0037206D5B